MVRLVRSVRSVRSMSSMKTVRLAKCVKSVRCVLPSGEAAGDVLYLIRKASEASFDQPNNVNADNDHEGVGQL